ncbi:MAG: MCE family protein [Kofleriaceae bacterium]|nr:MCE family protein [Kofleriaceae bacterium]
MSLAAQDPSLTRKVGAVSLVVLVLSIVFFVFIYDRIEWGAHTRIKIYFHTTGGLQEGAAFVVAGKTVGKVESIALSPAGAPGPLNGEEGVAVKVAIERAWARRIMKGGDVFITSRGALSGKYLEIGPPPAPGPTLAENDELLGRDPPSLDRVLQRTWDNLTTAAKFASEVRPEAHALGAELDKLRATFAELAPDATLSEDLRALIDEGDRTYAALGGEQGLDQLGDVLDRLQTTVAQARATIASLRASADKLGDSLGALRGSMGAKGAEAFDKIGQAIDRVRAAADRIDPLLAKVQAIQDGIARGEGSLLKLANDPEFPEDAKDLGKVLKRHPWRIIARPPK